MRKIMIVWFLKENYSLQQSTLFNLFCERFQVAAKSKEFSQLSREQILSLISSPRLLVPSEGAVYKAVVS